MAHRATGERRKAADKAGTSGRNSGGLEVEGPQYKTDEFRMFHLKVVPCNKRYCHDWTSCPFAHPGEKAKRRDPRKFRYTGIVCPEMKQGLDCPRGERCPFAHNVFEYWLHPSRYRTQLCNIAASCNRKICFFAHTIEELRVPAPVGGVDASQLLASATNHRLASLPTEVTPRSSRHRDQEAQPAPGPKRSERGHGKEALGRVVSASMPRTPRAKRTGGVSFPSQDPPPASPFGQLQQPRHTSIYSESQARQLLDMLRSTRQQAFQQHSSVAFADLSQVQALLQVIQQQQRLIQQQAQDKSAEETQNQTLQSLLGALYYQVTTQTMAEGERERLIKLLTWIFMQVVQSQGLELFGGDVQGPVESAQNMVLGTGILGVQYGSDQMPQGLNRGSGDRRSLSSIPETHTTLTAAMEAMGTTNGMLCGHKPGQWGAYSAGMMLRPSEIVDSEEVHRRRAPSDLGPLHTMVAQAVGNRLSMESSLNHGFSTPRGSTHSSAESAMSELWGVWSRQSGDSTTHSSFSDMQDSWTHDFPGNNRRR